MAHNSPLYAYTKTTTMKYLTILLLAITSCTKDHECPCNFITWDGQIVAEIDGITPCDEVPLYYYPITIECITVE